MFIFLIIVFYFIPTISAYSRKKRNAGSIFVLNFFLGWLIIPWVIALSWALSKDAEATVVIKTQERPKSVSNELVELFKLKEKGAITDEEFQEHKRRVLK